MSRTYGTLRLDGELWKLECEPHVAMWAKRVFPKISKFKAGVLTIKNSDAVCRDLEWLSQRFALAIKNPEELKSGSDRNRETILTLDRIVDPDYKPQMFELALPLREYQARATEMYLAGKHLLLGDDLGIGKTACAIASFRDQRTLPAVVVTLAHLPGQWAKEINRFAPDLYAHVLQKGTPYELPKFMGRSPDVIVTNYHKLAGWDDVLAKYCRSCVFDECQELRRDGSEKYKAAARISHGCDFSIGLSATPIFNFGGEIFNVINALQPGRLGTHGEFAIEWCEGHLHKQRLRDPVAFGSYLREQHIMLRRTRREVGRELPALQKITQEVDCDSAALNEIDDAAGELARIILERNPLARGDKMQAAEQFNNMLRQATGIAKAPYVAAFVKLLIENGERVLLYGYHHAVYEIWLSRLAEFEPAMFTGSESPSQKQIQKDRFVNGQTPLMIMSLRAGAGLDGLQTCCRTVVFGELDWSPGCLEQCSGRVYRDGQPDPVAAYYLLANDGADPIMAETLGLKREQIDGLRDLGAGDLERLDRNEGGVRKLAERYLSKHRVSVA